jgi:tetratricopeptide (TPR) repeat protein/ADP-heptose:LPS heptosyltransferase
MSEVTEDEFNELLRYFNNQWWLEGEIKSKLFLLKDPKNVSLLNFHGLFLSHQKKYKEAQDCFDKAIKINKNFIDSYNNSALNQKKIGNLENAEYFYKKALKINSNNPALNNNYAVLLKEKGDYNSSIIYYLKAIECNNNYFEAYNNLGSAYFKINKITEAIDCFNKAILLNPNYAEAYNNLGNIEAESSNNYHKAIEFYKKAYEINNTYVDAIHNLGNAYFKIYDLVNALKFLNLAISLDPTFTEAYNSLGMVFYLKQQFKEAEENYFSSLRIDPNNKLANFNLGVLYVRQEKFKEGWFYREKKRTLHNTFYHKEVDKLWDGKYVDGILYVWREQGVGDEISFLSMVYDLRDKAKFIYLEIDYRISELAERFFLKNNFNNIKIVKWNSKLERAVGTSFKNYDKHISIGSLGQFLRNDKDSFLNAKFPYLVPSQDKRIYFKNKLINNNKYNIGISWKTTNPSEIHRNITLDKIKKILTNINCNFYNLQFGDYTADKEFFNKNEELLTFYDIDYKDDFESIAALIAELDFVITIQNTIAHLSCALSKETWVMLSTFPRFNWGFEKDQCCWYPTAKIFRQKIISEWDEVTCAIEQKIKALPRKSR